MSIASFDNSSSFAQAHSWLSDKEREELCNIIDFQKLSVDACAHASRNERLPLRIVLQVLFCEQMHLRTALAGCLHALDAESAPAGAINAPGHMASRVVQRDGWVTVVRENQTLKVDMENMRSRVGELEEEFSKIKQQVTKVKKSHNPLSSPRLIARKFGCRFLPQSSVAEPTASQGSVAARRPSIEQAPSSRHSRHRKSFSLF